MDNFQIKTVLMALHQFMGHQSPNFDVFANRYSRKIEFVVEYMNPYESNLDSDEFLHELFYQYSMFLESEIRKHYRGIIDKRGIENQLLITIGV